MKNKKKFFFTIAAMLSGIAAMVSCTNNKGPQAVTPVVSFSKDVIPIFTSSCAISGACHAGAVNTGNNIDLDSSTAYSSIIAKDLINFPSPTASLLYVEISSGLMPQPPYSLLPTVQENLVLNWIKQGAKNN